MPLRLGSRAQSLLVLAALAALLGIASPHFLASGNLLNVVEQSAINALLGIGLTFVIISGGIDLSVGSVLAFCGIVSAKLLVAGYPAALAVVASVLIGTACGLINGLVTTLVRIPSFIVTLGMMLVARSAAKIVSNARPISGLPADFVALSGNLIGVPVFALVVGLCYLSAYVLLSRTRFGRYCYAIGGNEEAAWLSGIATSRYKVGYFALSGLMVGVAAVLMTARLNAASPLAGEMYELYAIAAAVIGGVSLMGGEGYVVGTLIGALIMGMLRNGLNLLNVPSAWEGLVVGLVLVLAVGVDRWRAHRSSSAVVARVWRRRLVVVGLGAAALTAAVMLRSAQPPAGVARQDIVTIAFVPKSMGNPFWVAMKQGAEQEAKRLGVRLVTLAADRESDVERQYQIIENLIEQRVAAILLAPAGSKEIVQAVRKANRARIPVLIVDSDIDRATARKVGAKTVTYIGSDNFRGGEIAGNYLGKLLGGRGEVAVIEGVAGHESTDRRVAGFREAIARLPGVEIVAAQTANSERERGFTVTQNILQSHPALKAIFAANDQMALGALEAVNAAERNRSVRVVGFDAAPDAIASIQAGQLSGSVAQYPSEMGRLGVLHAVALLRDKRSPPPVLRTRVELIDKANVATFVAAQRSGRPERP